MADSSDIHLATDSTGAEFWLVKRAARQPGGHRKIIIRGSKKHLPAKLEGLWLGGDAALRAVEDYLKSLSDAKKSSKKKIES